MSEKNYKDVLAQSHAPGKRSRDQREKIRSELKKLGDAYVDFSREKLKVALIAEVADIPLSPSLLAAGFGDSGIVMLSLSVKGAESRKVVVLTCAFAEGGAYPCEIRTDVESKVCKNFTAVQSALAGICQTQSEGVFNQVDKLKAEMEKKVTNIAPMTNEQPVPYSVESAG